eukprot:IDg13075t1
MATISPRFSKLPLGSNTATKIRPSLMLGSFHSSSQSETAVWMAGTSSVEVAGKHMDAKTTRSWLVQRQHSVLLIVVQNRMERSCGGDKSVRTIPAELGGRQDSPRCSKIWLECVLRFGVSQVAALRGTELSESLISLYYINLPTFAELRTSRSSTNVTDSLTLTMADAAWQEAHKLATGEIFDMFGDA